ncbi:YkvA family protein [Marinirhabdus gelatinilytica]|uniref:Uncharacterized membrane protein YkvA (DUF1232 family) n=1 Tax=Marinirhabdus gelatinilytica TaxID=1703343 RepID=A0A370QLW0_9FLAO|nr:DUF1232 domain-containing protein [Marinirhabdus gelatinilytica]RDK89329.1 uncharacterized membrane protein YkvA (DUF1232 family) [Marinirhabdus gelatinilytica]
MFFSKKKEKETDKNPIAEKIDEKFLEEKVVEVKDDDVELLLENEEQIEKKLAGANSLNKYVEIGKIMLGMVKDMKKGAYTSIPWFVIATIVMALLYILNPLDIVPDFIPGVGYIDDLAVLSVGIGWIETDIHKYLDWKLSQAKSSS